MARDDTHETVAPNTWLDTLLQRHRRFGDAGWLTRKLRDWRSRWQR